MRLITSFIATAFLLISLPARADTIEIPITLSSDGPMVAVSINGGAPESWLFDTGAMGSIMDLNQARALGLREEETISVGSPTGGTPVQGFVAILSGASIGGVALPPFHVAAIPSSGEQSVLSPSAFSGRLVSFDFAHARVRIDDKTPANLPRVAATMYLGRGHNRLPALAVTVGPHRWAAHLDSGSPFALIFPYAMARALPLAAPPVRVGEAHFVDSVHARYQATINGRVRVGPLVLENPVVQFIDGLPVLNVGMPLLRRMLITLDPAQQRDWAVATQP